MQTFLTNRYGYRPVPAQLTPAHYSMFRDIAAKCEGVKINLLAEWYQLDNNAVPPTYQLQSITSQFPHYNDHTHPDLCSRDQAAWWGVFSLLQQLFWKCADVAVRQGLLTVQEANGYMMSG